MGKSGKHAKSSKALYILLIPAACASILSLSWCGIYERAGELPDTAPEVVISAPPQTTLAPAPPPPSPEPTPTLPVEPEPEPEPEPPPPPMPWELFSPHFVEETDPSSEHINYRYDIQMDGRIVDEYLNPDPIFFGMPETYVKTESITTFRGNNFRNNPTFGTAIITEEKLTEIYRLGTSSLNHWTGV